MMEGRIIRTYEGSSEGPLLICLGGMHGNEPAGVLAIEEIFRLLDIESTINEEFQYRGTFVGLRGNLKAMEQKKRFIHRDLNRMLLEEEVIRIQHTPDEQRTSEDRECIDLIETVRLLIKTYNPTLTLILDLHTTTADGGMFTIAAEDERSKTIAMGLHAPVILGFAEKLKGTTLHYFHHPEVARYCIVFEAGRHDDPECVHRTAAAIVNCMRATGAVDSKDVDHRHDGLLIRLSQGLPKLSRLIYHYRIAPDEQFIMRPGYKNFQAISHGEILADNDKGEITSSMDGLILMPKYQSQGDDGFFIVEVVE